ncbi:hypothetical protein PtrM4_005190 [Pyrenophora tritici-repentis]|uniref:Uncharacterized protein n=1 Tax=Pyrenophora tritici-repentis TaxID=45151 RepID=A0A834VVM6_9PLEO|nr:hypothetical protein PtrM4_005190 [Pyrenophora tritici-repentis]
MTADFSVDSPAQTPAIPADWAESLHPIFRLKQRQPVDGPRLRQLHPPGRAFRDTPLDKRRGLVLALTVHSQNGSKAAAVPSPSGRARKASGIRVMLQHQILDAQL